MKVAVLKGGRSPLERGVSLRSGARVEDALAQIHHEAAPLDPGGDLVERLDRGRRPDVAFIAMHGRGGEDGTAQELEVLGLPFTGPGVAACATLQRQGARQAHDARRRGPDPGLVRLQAGRAARGLARRSRSAGMSNGSGSRSS